MNKSIQILVVDDSALVRQFMTEVIASQPDMALLATAPDPIVAMTKMQKQWPDVILLDVEMPKMDGITFLKQIMAQHPTPVVICSSLTEKGTALTLEAFSAGAVAVFTKATLGVRQHLQSIANDLIRAIREASQAKTTTVRPQIKAEPVAMVTPLQTTHSLTRTTDRVVAIGTSTGGTIALENILTQLPQDVPGIVIVQHIPAYFSRLFAIRLNEECTLPVDEGEDGLILEPSHAYIAPGDYHMAVCRQGDELALHCFHGPKIHSVRPAVDVLFGSVVKVLGADVLGVLLTGMGKDGADGLLRLRQAGAPTIGQDRETCVVYGMPRIAQERGALLYQLPLPQIGPAIQKIAGARY